VQNYFTVESLCVLANLIRFKDEKKNAGGDRFKILEQGRATL